MSGTTPTRWLAIALLFGGVGLSLPYLLAVSPYWNITPDSGNYVGGAASLAAGEGYAVFGRPIYLQPPMTSLIYAAALSLFPSGYLSLRVVTVAVLFLGLGAFLLVARRELGPLSSLAVVVLSLASVSLLQESTRLLSEPFYLCFSIVALVVIAASCERSDGWRWGTALGLTLLVASMTRIVGILLPGALLVCHGLRVARRTERFRPGLTVAASTLIILTLLWDLRSLHGAGISYFKLTLQSEPWVDEAGYLSPVDVVVRFVHHLSELGQIGRILTNDALPRFPQLSIGLALLGTGLFLAGLARSLTRRRTPTNLYVTGYVVVSLAYHPEVMARFFVPMIPFLFLYAALALVELARLIRRPRMRGVAHAVLATWAIVYVLTGLRTTRAEIEQQPGSPFGEYPIKYARNYDAQCLALWLRDHGERDAHYMSPFPDVYDFLTERRSVPIPLTRDAATVLARLAEHRVRYLLVSLKERYAREVTMPIIDRHPERFVLIRAEPDARLYEYRSE